MIIENKNLHLKTHVNMADPTRSNVVEESMLRPAHMSLVQLYVPLEVAQHTIAELGDLGVCQFRDVPAPITNG